MSRKEAPVLPIEAISHGAASSLHIAVCRDSGCSTSRQ
jgi:hypothetical protein